jgi:hypothetical protein
MRTTLTIDDDLLRQLKEESARQRKTLGAVVTDLLRQALAVRSQKPAFRLELEGWSAELQPGVDILDRDKLFDLLNGR